MDFCSPFLSQLTELFSSPTVSPFSEFHIIIDFWVWFHLLSIIHLRFIQVVSRIRSFLLFICVVFHHTGVSQLVYSFVPVEGYLHCFWVLVIINEAEQENVGSHQKKIPHVQGQRRSPSKMVWGAKSRLESNPISTRGAQRAQRKACGHQEAPTETEPDLPLRVWVSNVEVQVSSSLP